ncbi:MAG: hypothetical protein K2M76_00165, partial [Muribaculaceae bacterium]|nr:hypothetical protein [Muribaculaceae bacterium]
MKSFFYAHMAVIMACFMLGCGGANDIEASDKPTEPSVGSYFTATVGEPLPDWSEGTLDIHSISTGRGESYFYIFPDGTSMLVDAAGSLLTDEACAADNSAGCLPFRPNGNVTSGRVIADYVEHFNPHGKSVDYWLNSHFDGDHIGHYPENYAATNPAVSLIGKHPDGGFYLHGIKEIGTLLKFKKIIDRGYTSPIDLSGQKSIGDYIRFLNWTKAANGTVYEPAGVGRADQVIMTHNPGAYTGFSIRILCGGGWYWTGSGENTRCNLPVGADGRPDQQKLKDAGSKENISVSYPHLRAHETLMN